MPCGAVLGDFDNDSKTDIVVFGYRTLELYRNKAMERLRM